MSEVKAPPVVEVVNDIVVGAIQCRGCGRNLLGLNIAQHCPGCRTPVRESVATPSIDDAFCIQCGYALRGLQREGVCPECGTPIERSLRGNLLRYSSLDYVRSLRRGAWLVLAAIVVQVILVAGGIVAAVVLGGLGAAGGWSPAVDLAVALLGVAVGFMSLYGWWLLSEMDPAYAGRDGGTTSRKVIRVAVMIGAAHSIGELVYEMVPGLAGGALPMPVELILVLIGMAVWAVQFFASMLYLRWLAPRLPNAKAYNRAKMFMWLGPLLVTVGALCIGLGLVVALVMFWNMMYWIYRDLVKIEGMIVIEQVAIGR